MIYFFGAAADQEYSEQIETEANEKAYGSKRLDLLNLRHHLVDSKKHPDSGQHQENAPHELYDGFLSIHSLHPRNGGFHSRLSMAVEDSIQAVSYKLSRIIIGFILPVKQ
jgi:hypothetical protein